MLQPDPSLETDLFVKRAIEASIRVGLLVLMIAWCYQIVRPFLIATAWGIIIAVAAHPFYLRTRRILGDRRRLAAGLVSLLLLVALVGPVVLLGSTLFEGAESLARQLREGSLIIPAPPASVQRWPLIGERLSMLWSMAAHNLAAAVSEVAPQLKPVASWVVASLARAGFTLVQFLIATVIAGLLLANADRGARVAYALAERVAGAHGADWTNLAGATVRSVTRGILGVAFIQATLAGVGLLVVGVPGAGLWALVCLVLGIVQLPMGIVLIPTIIYVFITADTVPAVLFLVWNIAIAPLDNILKPILLGRGVKVPMAVIFIGAIGGAIGSGIIGLFVGAVVLVLAYKLLLAWLDDPAETDGRPPRTTKAAPNDTKAAPNDTKAAPNDEPPAEG